jgi:hypothetical protein
VLQNPGATARQKFQATQKLGEVWKNTLFTPEQIELVRRHMPELDELLPAQK